jgi:membrane protein EpsK
MDIFGIFSKVVQVAVIVLCFRYVSASLAFVGWGTAVSSLCVLGLTIIFAYILMPEIKITLSEFDFKAFREMTSMGSGVLINQLGGLLYMNSDLIVINILMGATATGMYGPIVQWATLIGTIAAVVTRSFDPLVMELLAKGDYETLKSNLFRLTKMLGLILGLPICLVCGFSKPLLLLWLGKDFVNLYKLMILLTLGQIIPYSLGTVFGIFRGLNTLKIPGVVTIVAGVFNVILAVILIKYTPLGMYGAGIATIIAVFWKGVLFNIIYLSRQLKFSSWKMWDALIIGCSPAVIFTVIIFIISGYMAIDHPLRLFIYGAIFSLIYCIVVYRLFMNKVDRRFTLRILKADRLLLPQIVELMVR